MKLIDKTSLVTEIKRRIKTNKVCMLGLKNLDYYQGKVDALSDTISFLYTLEVKEMDESCYNGFLGKELQMVDDEIARLEKLKVKEVDLEKNINDYFKDWKFDDELDIMVKPNNYSASFTDLKEIAKHFFELGIKAQKGKEV